MLTPLLLYFKQNHLNYLFIHNIGIEVSRENNTFGSGDQSPLKVILLFKY